MKSCAYCGRENTDEAARCQECGTEFVTASGTSPSPAVPEPENPAQTEARKRMFIGAVWCAGGIVVTFVTYLAAASGPFGGTYVVAWGAIVWGAIRFFQGWRARNTEPGKAEQEDLGYEALTLATRLETEGRIQEALVAYQKIVDEFPDSDAGRDARKSIESLLAKRG